MDAPPSARVYDLFVIHAADDESFVVDTLLPGLDLPAERVVLSTQLPVGEAVQHAMEQAVLQSRLSVVVLSEAYLRDRWAQFGEQLAGHAGGADAKIVPILLSDCKVPLRLDFRVALDMRDPKRWALEIARLRKRLARASSLAPGPRPRAADAPRAQPGPEAPSRTQPGPTPTLPPEAYRFAGVVAASVGCVLVAGIVGALLVARSMTASRGAERVEAPATSAPVVAVSSPASASSPVAAASSAPGAGAVGAGVPSSAAASSTAPRIGADGRRVTVTGQPIPDPDPNEHALADASWAGVWTDRMRGIGRYTEYTIQVSHGRPTVVQAMMHDPDDAGERVERLLIEGQTWSYGALFWTERIASARSSTSCRCDNHSTFMTCACKRPDGNSDDINLALVRR